MLDLNEIRNNIDKIDSQLVELFEERMKLTTEVAEYKIETGKKVLDPAREKAKLESVKKLVKNPDNVHAIDDLFAQIMANSRKNQYMLLEKMGQTLREPYEAIDEINKKNCKVVYQGVPGAYSYAAMINFFGKDVDNFNVPTWRECMEAVKQGKADYAVLPIENSNAGIVADVYDLLQEYNNYIIAETYVKIEHLLLGLPPSASRCPPAPETAAAPPARPWRRPPDGWRRWPPAGSGGRPCPSGPAGRRSPE